MTFLSERRHDTSSQTYRFNKKLSNRSPVQKRLSIYYWNPGSIPNNWADVCGFLEPPGSDRFWKVHEHGAFSIPRKTLGLRPTDQSCHHETWLHLDFVDWRSTQSHHDEHDRRLVLKERPAACPYGQQKRRISEVMSDHSLSS